jgi:hypothetical protein
MVNNKRDKLKEFLKGYLHKFLEENEVGSYLTPYAFSLQSPSQHFKKTVLYKLGYRLAAKNPLKHSKMFDIYKNGKVQEVLTKLIKQELLNEVTYNKFRNNVSTRTKPEQLHKAIKEVKRRLQEVNKLVEYTSRMKSELSESEEGIKHWKNTEKSIMQISEMAKGISCKVKKLYK